MPKCVFSFILPRFFPDLMSISDSYWLELSVSRSHHFIFTTSKSGIFSIEKIWVACCFGMMLFGKASTFSRFCFWWSFPLVNFPLGMRTDLLFTGKYFKSICWFHPIATCSLCMPNPGNYLFTLQYPQHLLKPMRAEDTQYQSPDPQHTAVSMPLGILNHWFNFFVNCQLKKSSW